MNITQKEYSFIDRCSCMYIEWHKHG